jgi:hypothetical protein
MVVIYHRNTPLPKVRKGLDGYTVITARDAAFAGADASSFSSTRKGRGEDKCL